MQTRTWFRSASALAVLGAAAAFLSAARGDAWAPLGGTLDLDRRGFRVFPNFVNPEANDNAVPDPNFPGALGAALAVWKGVAEWGSGPRYDGLGDPTQPVIGSGGANFDSVYLGLASGPGRTNDNVISGISGCSLGTVAFCETPISDGWRIRFRVECYVFEDAPGLWPAVPDGKDIQGVATHEYGHALGLDHSGLPGEPTMFPSSSGQLITRRSIEADDIAGVQALYGVKSASKPQVATYELNGGTLVVRGANFAAFGNEVWLTSTTSGASGLPRVVQGLASNGTEISLALPLDAAPGDLVVRVPGTSGAALSNAMPFDPLAEPCPIPSVYGTAKLTSQGTFANLYTSGRPRMSLDDFAIATDGGIPLANGILFSGGTPTAAPFFGGTLLAQRPLVRHRTFQFDFLGGVTLPIAVTPAMVGTTRYYQLWFQDTGDPFGVGLSDAVRVTFCP